ncbi:MAG: hypothetical protein AAF456_15285 [Planctomycetota bacterium]
MVIERSIGKKSPVFPPGSEFNHLFATNLLVFGIAGALYRRFAVSRGIAFLIISRGIFTGFAAFSCGGIFIPVSVATVLINGLIIAGILIARLIVIAVFVTGAIVVVS